MTQPNAPSDLPPTNPIPPGPPVYVPAVGPRLKIVLAVLFALVALLGASGAYLSAITVLDWWSGPEKIYTNTFTLSMLLAHIAIGLVTIVPFLYFGGYHLLTSLRRPNRVAVRLGMLLFLSGLLVCGTGVALLQFEGFPQLPTGTTPRLVARILHVVLPLLAIAFYVLHRRAGPDIQWRWGYAWLGGTGAFVVAMTVLHGLDPRDLNARAPKEGELYFFPSEARTAKGNFIPAQTLMTDTYCMRCHQDIYQDHFHSSHRFSSFNNPPYLFSVRETRKVALARDGNVKAARWCAGCHDPVPFFSGAFDDPNFDDVNHETAHAGITCASCHAITSIHGTTGNGAYTIEESPHYPFAFSDNPQLQWVNNQLIKARPEFHKRTFLKPVHRSAEFCSTCHKVSLPAALNHYKDFLRGQDHYASFLLSGVSGHNARAFYYPPTAKSNCSECHMPLKPSGDFGARDFDGSGQRKIHNHMFPGANTGLFTLLPREPRYSEHAEGFARAVKTHADFLRGTDPEGKDRKVRIDIFGLKEGDNTDAKLLTPPLRPRLPELRPGSTYLVEVVVRTLALGHLFSQGTVDSNEIWVDFQAKSGNRVIARNGALANEDETGPVDEWSHFINVLMLDRNGNRINRRNPQDIFTPLYNHQIPPGAAHVLHYRLDVPADLTEPVELRVRVRYRKFDYEYMQIVHEGRPVPKLPIVDMCEDHVYLPLAGQQNGKENQVWSSLTSPTPPPEWQRWNDYGIGCLLEGGEKSGHFRQAEAAFKHMLTLGVKDAIPHAHVNLARVYINEGRLEEAAQALDAARRCDPPAPWWSIAWFTSVVNSETATSKEHLDAAIANLERLLDPKNQPRERGFDFSKDYVVLNKLANLLFKRSKFEEPSSPAFKECLDKAVERAERVLELEIEDVEAHDMLRTLYARLGQDFTARGEVPPAADLPGLAATLANKQASREDRVAAAGRLALGVEALANEKLDPAKPPRLPRLVELRKQLRVAYHAEDDPTVKTACAGVLTVLHASLHQIYKPDEIARARTTQLYRDKHPAANYAARHRVIYPTTAVHRQTILKTGDLQK